MPTTLDIYLDNSSLAHLSCLRRYQQAVLLGRRPEGNSISLDFGSAFHRAVELLVKGTALSVEEACGIACAEFNVTSIDYRSKALLLLQTFRASSYYPHSPLRRPDGTPYCETKFTEPLDTIKVRSPEGAITLNFHICGTIDLLEIHEGELRITDYKTTSKKSVTDVFASYELTSQRLFYAYFLRNFGSKYLTGEALELALNNRIKTAILGAFYLTSPMTTRMSPHKRFDAYDYAEMGELLRSAMTTVCHLISIYGPSATVTAAPTGTGNGACRLCDYKDICITSDRARREELFARLPASPYNPLAFR